MFRTRDPQLLRRAAAARAVLPDVEPEDRPLLLSLVCWPPTELLVAERAAAEDGGSVQGRLRGAAGRRRRRALNAATRQRVEQ
jgi:hypothetical protein